MELLAAADQRLAPSTRLADAIEQVLQIRAEGLDDAVVAFQSRIVAFAEANPDALDRSCAAAHLTGSALVVDARGERIVLLHHRKLDKWLQPGGHTDGDGNLARTALREATEETGIEGLRVLVPAIDIDIHRVAPPAEAPHDHLDVRYLVVAPDGAELVGNHESKALRWVEPGDLGDYDVDDGLRRLCRAGMAAARGLLDT